MTDFIKGLLLKGVKRAIFVAVAALLAHGWATAAQGAVIQGWSEGIASALYLGGEILWSAILTHEAKKSADKPAVVLNMQNVRPMGS